MKFKTTLVLSVALHASLAAFIIVQPAGKGSGEMTYYVDLVNLGGGGGGGGGWPAGGGRRPGQRSRSPRPRPPWSRKRAAASRT